MVGYLEGFSTQRPVVGLGNFIATISAPAGVPWGSTTVNPHMNLYKGPNRDSMGELVTRALHRGGYYDAATAVRHILPGSNDQDTFPIEGPKMVTTDYNLHRDDVRFGSFVARLRESTRNGVPFVPVYENDCSHTTFRGKALPIYRDGLYRYTGQVSLYGHTVPTIKAYRSYDGALLSVPPLKSQDVSGYPSNPVFAVYVGGTTTTSGNPRYFLDDLIMAVVGDDPVSHVISYKDPSNKTWAITQTYSNMRWQYLGENALSLEYSLLYRIVDGLGNEGHALWNVRWTFSTAVLYSSPIYSTNGRFSLSTAGMIGNLSSYEYEWNPVFCYYVDANGTHYLPLTPGYYKTVPELCYWDTVSASNTDVAPIPEYMREEARQYRYWIDRKAGDLLATTYYSSVDAVEPLFEKLKTNHLETLSELQDILDLIPDVGLLIRALVDIRQLRLRGLKELGDFVASTYLKYQFGVKPSLDAINELNARGRSLLDYWDALKDGLQLEGHGRFDFDFPSGYFPERYHPVHLTTRSKIRLRVDEESLLLSLLGMKSAGLMPSLSSIWEILPGSFIIDWFTNMQRRYADIDMQGIFLACDIDYCVHSLTLSSPVADSVLEPLQIRSHPGDPLMHRRYLRLVSRYMPTIRETSIDFRAPVYNPSFGIVGSLIWTILS